MVVHAPRRHDHRLEKRVDDQLALRAHELEVGFERRLGGVTERPRQIKPKADKELQLRAEYEQPDRESARRPRRRDRALARALERLGLPRARGEPATSRTARTIARGRARVSSSACLSSLLRAPSNQSNISLSLSLAAHRARLYSPALPLRTATHVPQPPRWSATPTVHVRDT